MAGRLVIPTWDTVRDSRLLVPYCATHGVTVLKQTPSAFVPFMQVACAPDAPPLSLRHVMLAGESLEEKRLGPWWQKYRDSIQVTNLYGPTEATVDVSIHMCEPNHPNRQHWTPSCKHAPLRVG